MLPLLLLLTTWSSAPSRLWAHPDSLDGHVVIHRDEFGVPHIFAASIAEGYYGLGYAQAEDILEPLLLLILSGRGELASVQGQALVASDLEQRRWLHVEAARAGFPRLSPTLQQAYRSYIRGIRAFMAEHPQSVPAWAPELEPWDAIVLTRSAQWLGSQAGEGLRDCRRGGVTLAEAATASLAAPGAVASNEWALAPWRTAEGATILLADPHGGIDATIIYEFRMHAGELATAGYAIGPMLMVTHTRRLAVGHTTGFPDSGDCYEIDVDPKQPRRYRYDGRWETMVTRQVKIAVKDGAPITRSLEYTRHNGVLSPVVARVGNKAYVVSTAYMDDAATPAYDEEAFRLNFARNVFEAKEVLRTLGMYPQNLLFGDADGNLFYVRFARTPIRPSGFDWTRPVPGNTSATAWRGRHPVDDLVQVTNPPQGYLQNNNVAPDMMVRNGSVSASRYPPYLFNDTPGRTNTRGLRAMEVLSNGYAFTMDDAVELALDEKWYGTESWLRLLRDALAARNDWAATRSGDFRRFADALLRFDGHARATSPAALKFLAWQEAVPTTLPEALLPELDRLLDVPAPPSVGVAKALTEAIDTAMVALRRWPGPAEPTLGDIFRVGRDTVTWPLGGVTVLPRNRRRCVTAIEWDRHCLVTLRAMTFGRPDSLGRRRAFLGSRMLMLVSLGNPVRAYTLHLFGQSSDPGSPHSIDQLPLASARKLKPVYFEPAELEGHIVSTKRLTVPASYRP